MIKYVIISIKNNLSNLLNPQHENKEKKKKIEGKVISFLDPGQIGLRREN